MSDALSSRDWTAIHDHEPPVTDLRLRVRGTVEYPRPGYKAWLERAEPQGIDPLMLELELRETPPSDVQSEVITPVEVDYEEATETEHRQVHVRPLDALFDVSHPQ